MKRRNFIFVATILTIVLISMFALSSCASKDLTKILNKELNVNNVSRQVTAINQLKGYTKVGDVAHGLCIFEKDGQKSLYSFKTSSFVKQNAEFRTKGDMFIVETATAGEYDVYSHTGVVIQAKYDDIHSGALSGYVTVGDKRYEYNQNEDLVLVEEEKPFAPKGNAFGYVTDKYNVLKYTEAGVVSYIVLDKETEEYKFAINISDYVVTEDYYVDVLSNGNIILQERILLPDNEKTYDFILGKNKFNLRTQVINIASGKAKKINTKFVIESIENDTKAGISDKYRTYDKNTNLLTYIEIDEKQYTGKERIQFVDSNLNVKVDLQKILRGASEIGFVGDGGISLRNDLEVLNYKDAKTQFRYMKSTVLSDEAGFLVTKNAIFDSYGNQILATKELKNFNIEHKLSNGVLVYKNSSAEDETKLVTIIRDRNGKTREILDTETLDVNYDSFSITKDGKITVYLDDLNAPINSTPIEATTYETDFVMIGEDFMDIMQIGTEYYCIKTIIG